MEKFTLNGTESPLPLAPERPFRELLQLVRRGSEQIVSTILVNDVELSEEDEKELAEVPLSDIRSVELSFCSALEIVISVLNDLLAYSSRIALLSRNLTTDEEYSRLIDAIQIFSDALNVVKPHFKYAELSRANILEADLQSILTDLLDALKRGNIEYRNDLLTEHLPANMNDWRTECLPRLISARSPG